MSKFIGFLFVFIFFSCQSPNPTLEANIIPKPLEINHEEGKFTFESSIKVYYADASLSDIAHQLKQELKHIGIEAQTSTETTADHGINLLIDNQLKFNDEGYTLGISKNGINLKGKSPHGVFNGIQSFLQLVHQNKVEQQINLPFLTINDEPRFSYRGMHLDVGRRFYSVEFLKKYIDVLVLHKINRFHWHLTEDQGWRIAIKNYSKLTEIGANRAQTSYDNQPIGGFYTQEEIKEVIQYAQDKYITIIPEIEMPGHAVAALAAYPELSCTGGPFKVETNWGVFKDVFCAGKEETFQFLEQVLIEVMDLFPSEYIHIGGDEVPKDRWRACQQCQQRIKTEGLANEDELQSYFIKRIQGIVNAHGKKIIGWDEILEGGLAKGATVMSWRGEIGGIESAKKGHQVIMSPDDFMYFNYFQGDGNHEPHTIGKQLKIDQVYQYNPVPQALSKEEGEFIKGVQACLWTERIPTEKETEYMLLPRLSALAEVAWSSEENKNFDDFIHRLQTHKQFLKSKDYTVSNSDEDVFITTKINSSNHYEISLNTLSNSQQINYSIDGTEPSTLIYNQPLEIKESTIIKAVNSSSDHPRMLVEPIQIHQGFLKNYTTKNDFMNGYKGAKNGLTDGLFGSVSYGDGRWQGVVKEDLIVTVNLEELKEVNHVSCNFLSFPELYLFAPKQVEIYTSKDGVSFQLIEQKNFTTTSNPLNRKIESFNFQLNDIKAQYVKLVAKNIGTCPSWHKTAGKDARLFADEIVIN